MSSKKNRQQRRIGALGRLKRAQYAPKGSRKKEAWTGRVEVETQTLKRRLNILER
jgi:hypothetical protein